MAVSSGEVEEDAGTEAGPGHHVEDGRLSPAKAAPVVDGYRLQHKHPELLHSTNCLISELPLILESASCISHLERVDPHDEVVNKLNWNWQESLSSISEPP